MSRVLTHQEIDEIEARHFAALEADRRHLLNQLAAALKGADDARATLESLTEASVGTDGELSSLDADDIDANLAIAGRAIRDAHRAASAGMDWFNQ